MPRSPLPRHPLPLFQELRNKMDLAPFHISRGDTTVPYEDHYLEHLDKEILSSPTYQTEDRVYIQLYQPGPGRFQDLALLEYSPRKRAHRSLKLLFAGTSAYAGLRDLITSIENRHSIPCYHCSKLFSSYHPFAFVLDAKDPGAQNFCGIKCRDEWALQFKQKELADLRKRP